MARRTGLDASDPDDIIAWLPDSRVPAAWAEEIEAGSTDDVLLEVLSTETNRRKEEWVSVLAVTAVYGAARTVVGWSESDQEWQLVHQSDLDQDDVDAEQLAEEILQEERGAIEEWRGAE